MSEAPSTAIDAEQVYPASGVPILRVSFDSGECVLKRTPGAGPVWTSGAEWVGAYNDLRRRLGVSHEWALFLTGYEETRGGE